MKHFFCKGRGKKSSYALDRQGMAKFCAEVGILDDDVSCKVNEDDRKSKAQFSFCTASLAIVEGICSAHVSQVWCQNRYGASFASHMAIYYERTRVSVLI